MVEFKLGYMEEDALQEVASIACGNASATLSSLLGDRMVGVITPTVGVISLKDVVDLVGGPKKLVVGTYAQVSGDISGNAVVVFPRESAFLSADLFGNKKLGTTQAIGEQDQKLIGDAGADVVSSYLTALKTLLKLEVDCGGPKFFSAFGESVTDFLLMGSGGAEETFLVTSFRTPFSVGPDTEGEFIFMLALKPVDALLEVIRSKLPPGVRLRERGGSKCP